MDFVPLLFSLFLILQFDHENEISPISHSVIFDNGGLYCYTMYYFLLSILHPLPNSPHNYRVLLFLCQIFIPVLSVYSFGISY